MKKINKNRISISIDKQLDDILNEELWSGVEYLIIEIPFSKKEIIKNFFYNKLNS